MEEKVGINWFGVFSKILFLAAFALILLWLYPNNTLSPFYDQIFNNNVQTMKDAAKDYFTVERLPEDINGTAKITLGDMIDAKMILEFNDKNGNSCSMDKSYVEAKRVTNDRYELKVSLTCGKESDYIIDTIGCYDLCNGDCSSSTDIDSNSSIEYEFSRSINKMEYSCEVGYVLSGTHCYKSSIGDKYKAEEVSSGAKTETTNANVSNGSTVTQYADSITKTSYVCGSQYDNAGTYDKPTTCTKKTVTTAPSTKTTTYICGQEYVNHGSYSYPTLCYKNASSQAAATKVTNYVCSSAYDNAGTYSTAVACQKVTTASAPSSTITKYVCSSAYDNAGTYNSPVTCSKRTTSSATPQSSTTDGHYTSWSCGSCNVRTFTAGQSSTSTTKFEYQGSALKYVCTSSSCPGYITVYYYIVYTRSWVPGTTTTSYVCSGDYENAGTYSSPTTCYKNTSAASTPQSSTVYTCGSTYDNAGTYSSPTTCRKTVIDDAQIVYTYVCSSAYDNAGTYSSPTTCVKTTSQGYQAQQVDVYGCSSIYDNAGTYTSSTTCVKTTTTSDNSQPSSTYSCPTGYNQSGTGSNTTCSKVITSPGKYYCSDANATLSGDKCIKTVSSGTKYSCKTGYTLSGGYCYKYNNEKIDATSKCVLDRYEYKWSTEKSLDGWGRTGKYRILGFNDELKENAGCLGCNCSNSVTCQDTTSSEQCDCSK